MKWYHWIFIVSILASLQKCANQTAPNGGPKDSIPPSLVSSNPSNNQKNFKGKTITLNFNEFIKLKDAKEIIITPSAGKNPIIQAKGKSLTIEPKEKWKDSTTYSISFREAIQDITESLPTRNLHLAFSTGPVIDSLSIEGTTTLVLQETIPERVTVALYRPDTFNIFKHSPVYFTESTKDGTFKLTNLKPGHYKIYAFADKNKNLKVDSQSELYGFKSDTLNLDHDIKDINIRIIAVDTRKLKVNNVRNNSKQSTIKLSKPASTYHLTTAAIPLPLNTYSDNQAEIVIYHTDELKDSTLVHLYATDSVSNHLDTAVYIKASDGRFIPDKFKVTVTETSINTETAVFHAKLKFSTPIKKIKEDTLRIRIDSANASIIKPLDIHIDTATKTASITCYLTKQALEENYETPTLIFSKGVFVGINNDSSAAIKTPLTFLKETETGKLSVKIITKVPHYIIQLLDKDYTVVQQYRDQKIVDFSFLKPADYKIRAIIDSNNNGVWDLGSYLTNTEPEKIIYLKMSPKSYDTPLRANWEATAPNFSF